jgi:hypothetical protein
VHTIATALDRIKGALHDRVPESLIQSLLRKIDHRHRDSVLTPVVTTYLFLQQILNQNTSIAGVRRLSGMDFTPSAYCQARGRLPVKFFRSLSRAVITRCCDEAPACRWRGHRLVLIDGTGFSMPDTDELREAFGQPSGQAPGCGFPVAHLLAVVDADTGYLLQSQVAPMNTHDSAAMTSADSVLERGDVVIADRGFCSFAHMARLRERGVFTVFRLHQKQIVSFRPHRRHATAAMSAQESQGLPRSRWIERLGKHDQIVEYFKPVQKPDWMTDAEYEALPETLLVREVRFRVRIPGHRVRSVTLATTLVDPNKYSAKALAKLYRRRWQIEVDLRHLKQTLGMDVLHCQTVPSVIKEMYMFVTIYNLVRRVMVEAARKQKVEPRRISFVDALRWLRSARPGDEVPILIVNPERPGRYEPRVRKRRPKQYPLMKQPRRKLKKQAQNAMTGRLT